MCFPLFFFCRGVNMQLTQVDISVLMGLLKALCPCVPAEFQRN